MFTRRFAYYAPYPDGQMPTMPSAPAEGGAAQAAASAVVEKQVGLEPAMVQATVSEMAKQAIGVDDELFLDSALMDSGMAPWWLTVFKGVERCGKSANVGGEWWKMVENSEKRWETGAGETCSKHWAAF